MINDDKQDEIRLFLQRLLGLPVGGVRPADDDQPTEGNEYAIVQFTEFAPTGWAGNGKDARQAGIMTLTIDFMGNNAGNHAYQLPIAMQTNYAIDTMLGLNMGYISCDNPRDLTSLEIERTERYQVKLRLSCTVAYDKPDTLPSDYQSDNYINQVPIGLIAES